MAKRKLNIVCLFVIFNIIFAAFFSFGAGTPSTSPVNDPNEIAKAYMDKLAELDRQITASATQGFEPSLEKKENVDFVLTPALLMQEIMSEEVVLTYPTE